MFCISRGTARDTTKTKNMDTEDWGERHLRPGLRGLRSPPPRTMVCLYVCNWANYRYPPGTKGAPIDH